MGKVNDLRENVKDYLEKEDVEFNGSLQEYARKNPEPKKPIVLPSLIFWFGLISAIAAMGTSGLRVFDRFYQVALLSGGAIWLANLEAIFGVIAVNFTLLAMAFFIAYKKGRIDNGPTTIALIISVFISLTAGLGQSFFGLKMTQATSAFDWVLAFALGGGITGLEYFSGSLLGIEYNLYVYDKEEKLKLFKEEHKLWLKGARGQFGGWVSRFHKFAGDDSPSPQEYGGENDNNGKEAEISKDWRKVKNIISDREKQAIAYEWSTSQISAKYGLPSDGRCARNWKQYAVAELSRKEIVS